MNSKFKSRCPTRKSSLTEGLFRVLCVLLLMVFSHLSFAAEPQLVTEPTDPKVIRSASEIDYPPYCIVSAEGQADGFSVELLRAVLKTMGHEVSFTVGPWDDVKQSLIDGRVQVLPLVGRTPEREKLFDFTFPYLTMHGTLVVRSSDPRIRSLADLSGKKVAVMRGDNAEEFVRRIHLNADIVTTSTFDQALLELSEGKHDAVVIQRLLALQLIQQAGLKDLRSVGPPLLEFQQSFCFAVAEGDKELLEILNEGLSIVVADGTFRRLHSKWFAPLEAAATAYKRIVVGGDSDYPPYEFLDENGEPAGYNVELTRAIARQLGLEVTFRLGPWNEIRAALSRGEIDLIQGLFFSAERQTEFDFSTAHTVVSHAIAVRDGTPMPKNLSDLAGKSILVMRGDIMYEAALESGYAEQLIPVDSQEEALRRLAAGEADCALVAKLPARYWMETYGWKNLRLSAASVQSPEFCFGFPKGKSQLVAFFSEGLAELRASGEYRQIYAKWLGVYDGDALPVEQAIKMALWVVIPLLLLLLGAGLWSRTLRRAVRSRTLELRKENAARKRAQTQLARTIQELERSNQELEQFAYVASHDLQEPLRMVKSYLNLLSSRYRERLDPDARDFIAFAVDGAVRMQSMISDLLTYSRAGKADRPLEPTALDAPLDRALGNLKIAIEEGGAKILRQPLPTLPVEAAQIQQLFQNLIGNALKFNRSETPQVEITASEKAEGWIFAVADNGIGIDPKEFDRLFVLFKRLHGRDQFSGTGIGLALCKKIVERHGGRIWIESAPGQGTTFFFSLTPPVSVE